MAESLPLAAVAGPLHSLLRRAARMRERVTITDQDEPSAVVISADELEDLEDELAVPSHCCVRQPARRCGSHTTRSSDASACVGRTWTPPP